MAKPGSCGAQKKELTEHNGENNNDNCMGSKLNYNAQMVKQNAEETGCNERHELDRAR